MLRDGPVILPYATQGQKKARQHVPAPPGWAQQLHSPVFHSSSTREVIDWSDDGTVCLHPPVLFTTAGALLLN